MIDGVCGVEVVPRRTPSAGAGCLIARGGGPSIAEKRIEREQSLWGGVQQPRSLLEDWWERTPTGPLPSIKDTA